MDENKIVGKLYQETHNYIQQVDPKSVFVEIGSDRWEGSTKYFAQLAEQYHTQLITVDIDDSIRDRFENLTSVNFVVAPGEEWAESFGSLNKTISVLYLDNFDYDWEVKQHNPMIATQQQLYKDRYGIEMHNINCQKAHLQQMISLLPYMTKHSVVVCDDTYRYNDCFIGKCGAVIPYLLLNGYTIQKEQSYGVILSRNPV
jgi:hypothetical protein